MSNMNSITADFTAVIERALGRPVNLDEFSAIQDFLKFAPTAEQLTAVEAALTTGNLVITACAGSGKTSTLRLIAFAMGLCFAARGYYIAYNKAIQMDAAGSFPKNVVCKTAHSLAYGAVGHRYRSRLNSKRLTGRMLARVFDIEDSFPLDQFGDRTLTPARLASLVMQTVGVWCHSADAADRKGFMRAAGKVVRDVPGAEEVSHDLAKYLAIQAEAAWNGDLRHESGRLPFSHDMYVKVWALGDPVIPADFILYDEAQDADPCIADVVLRQEHAQLIAVGDECQAIYGWRGAVDAMATWPADHRVALTKSFRFGQAVADEANVFLGILGAPLRVEGAGPESVVGPVEAPDAVLCRTNGEVVSQALIAHDAGRTFAIVGGTDAIRKFAEAAESLMNGRPAAWHADLGAFKRWGDVVQYVKDEGGSDIGTLVRMVENYGADTLYEVCDNSRPEGEADVVLSTAHKAKGREWGSVVIGGDFVPSEDREREGLSRAEAMLMYVAVTRAKRALDAAALSWAKTLEAA